ncbi:SRPBCC domain-containing protein [Sphingorhabdus sp. Alg239-R122]|uniref:SRPBCC domain-containing protein n=1 Tax=Sphingorhabdus sp. Alg239-R122 TaxID=2305989 RepID=UPI0013D90C46|nr:SRPBCC domain-containing protein [Sphingorhabdus sp. Alg239-R122]
MDLKFKVSARIAGPVEEVFEAVADPDKLSAYFTTAGAKGRIKAGATVIWGFHDCPGPFPVLIREVVENEKIVLEWETSDEGVDEPYMTETTMTFEPLDNNCRTLVTVTEKGWRKTQTGLDSSYSNCMGWSQMLCAMKAWVEHGINLREGMYR